MAKKIKASTSVIYMPGKGLVEMPKAEADAIVAERIEAMKGEPEAEAKAAAGTKPVKAKAAKTA